MANFQLVDYVWNSNSLNSTKVKLKNSIYRIQSSCVTSFFRRAGPIRHSLFYNGQFSIRILHLAVKLLKQNQIKTKIL